MTKLFENAITAVFKITYFRDLISPTIERVNPEEPNLPLFPELLSINLLLRSVGYFTIWRDQIVLFTEMQS